MTIEVVGAISWDVDGPLVDRFPLRFQGGALHQDTIASGLARFLGKQRLNPRLNTPATIPEVIRECTLDHLNRWEILTQSLHRVRPVVPEAPSVLAKIRARGYHNYLNTGRPDTLSWRLLTLGQVDPTRQYIDGCFFTPKHRGISSTQSKIAAARSLTRKYTPDYFPSSIWHIDDNPFDALPMAEALADQIGVILFRDWSTNWIMKGSRNDHRNLYIIDQLDQIFDIIL